MNAQPPLPPNVTNFRPSVGPARGWFLIVIGVGLSVGIAYLANVIHGLIERDHTPGSDTPR